MSDKHLKTYQYYSDLYDRHTVELCRITDRPSDHKPEIPKDKKISKRQALDIDKWAKELILHFRTGERYLNKENTIKEWMDADKAKDDLYESAQAPEDIRCLTCRNRMVPTFKDLWSVGSEGDRVLFMYDCPNKCMPRRAFFSDGEEWRSKPNLCPSCSTEFEHKEKNDGIKLVTTYTCPKCKFVKTDEIVWSSKKEEEIDDNFAKDRDRFCLTEEKGKEFQEEKYDWEQMAKFSDEWKKEDEAREEKLKANPKGFHLDGVGYSCAICGNSTPLGDNWYDK